MGRCERCGADALNVHGICRNCGWQAPEVEYDDRPSIGETRAADALPVSPAPASRGATAAYQRPSNAGAMDPTRARGQFAAPATPISNGPASRFCGVCGARITGNEMFCGQCGAPVNVDPATIEAPAGLGGRYQPAQQWGADDTNAYTEAIQGSLAPVPGRAPYGGSDPYGRGYPTSYTSSAPAAQGEGLSRSARITLGVVFLIASVICAVIVISLAIYFFG